MAGRKKKRGQLMGMPFIYIFAIIMGALILAWGISTVYKLMATACEVENAKMAKDLEAGINEYFNYDEGSAKQVPMRLCKDMKYVCITDPATADMTKCKKKTKEGKIVDCANDKAIATTVFTAILKSQAKASKAENLFFLPLDAAKRTRFTLLHVKPAEGQGNPLCFAAGSKMVMTSKTTYVEAS